MASRFSPFISVVIPTFKRLRLLRAAVQSVFDQDYESWELVISDDERSVGDTWEYLSSLARQEHRVRIVKNTGTHGQVGNVNSCLRNATGRWIKVLFDDDLLSVNCLAEFSEAAEANAEAALISCLVDRYVQGRLVKRGNRMRISRDKWNRISGKAALLGLYLHRLDIGMPSQVMVRRDCVRAGAVWECVDGLTSGVDAWWFARLLARGDLVVINKTLVQEHQGGHASVTSFVSEAQLDAELVQLKHMIAPLVPECGAKPPVEVVSDAVHIIRGFHRLYKTRSARAIRPFTQARCLHAWRIAGHWLLRQLFPVRFGILRLTDGPLRLK